MWENIIGGSLFFFCLMVICKFVGSDRIFNCWLIIEEVINIFCFIVFVKRNILVNLIKGVLLFLVIIFVKLCLICMDIGVLCLFKIFLIVINLVLFICLVFLYGLLVLLFFGMILKIFFGYVIGIVKFCFFLF